MAFTVAIPTAGPELDAECGVALPHSAYLLLVDPATLAFEAHQNPARTAQSHRGVVVAKFLLERGVEVVLGHHMGPHPAAALTRNGVAVHEAKPGATARELLALFRQGALPRLTEEEINRRHGPGHHAPHA
jgi:predicted Fe-Mo cluster-binding NifX family protein